MFPVLRTTAMLLATLASASASIALAQVNSSAASPTTERQSVVTSQGVTTESQSTVDSEGNIRYGSSRQSTGQPGGGGARGGGGGGFGGAFGGGGQFGGIQVGRGGKARVSAAERPIILVTQPMSTQLRSEWKEDLEVMDKLLSDSIGRVSGESSTAMGIRVVKSDNIQPMYLEGSGMLLSYGVNLPLAAAAPAASGTPQPRPSEPSAWERAKRELSGDTPSEGGTSFNTAASGRVMSPTIKFDPSKLDELIAAVLKTLPEAKNVRHLKADEFAVITISGFDDGGAPLRLTLRAKKIDIDESAAGRLSPEEFKKRVAWHVG